MGLFGSERKTTKVKVKVAQSCLTLCNPMDCIVHRILQGRTLWCVALLSPGDLPNPGIKPRSPVMQEDSLPAEPPGKPKNTGVGSLSLLQGLFPTQESNQGLPCCRQIPYSLIHREALIGACFSAFHLQTGKDVALIPAPLSPSSKSLSRNPALKTRFPPPSC